MYNDKRVALGTSFPLVPRVDWQEGQRKRDGGEEKQDRALTRGTRRLDRRRSDDLASLRVLAGTRELTRDRLNFVSSIRGSSGAREMEENKQK